MAKRGYRGKFPHNDMKVSKHTSNNKRLTKLDVEYDKLNDKQKYSYIRDHQGFFPQGSMTISGTLDMGTCEITMSAADGTIFQIKGAGSTATGATPATFKADGNAAQASDGILQCVNANMGGKITASVASEVVTLTQDAPGPDGNTTITVAGGVQLPDTVAFNGVAANNSGSGFLFTGG
tara:strand:- start:355 stop:891 length:537 start_codon:yes stop_codon:yes gene_type:complete